MERSQSHPSTASTTSTEGSVAAAAPHSSHELHSTSTSTSAQPQQTGGGGGGEVAKRAIATLFMAYVFLGIVSRGAEIVMPLILLIKVMMYYEVLRISQKERKDSEVPMFRMLHWYFLAVVMWFCAGLALREPLVRTFPQLASVLFELHTITCFALSVGGFLAFVLSLKRGMYRYQFQQFTWMCMTLIFIVGQGTLQLQNMRRGMFWFLLPASCVVHNDVWAYYCGKLFGKTPLLRLSPKKTWEGFIGSWFFTMIWSFWFAGFMSSFPAMYCPKNDFHSPLICERDAIFEKSVRVPFVADLYEASAGWKAAQQHPLAWLAFVLVRNSVVQFAAFVSPVQLHALVFGAFASLIAPFGGFFASGLKRAFKLKDFGDSIPGHGGVTDRMDCQIIMGAFTFIYLNFVVFPPTWGGASMTSSLSSSSPSTCPATVAGLAKCISELAPAARAQLLAPFLG